ncbi:MAG: hypothetical protein ACLSHM_01480 [Vescimonas sp.]
MYSDTVTTDHWVGPRLLCVSMYYSSYSGGAPQPWRLAVSFDLNNGQALQMTDLTDDADGMRAAVAESLLYQVKRVMSGLRSVRRALRITRTPSRPGWTSA